MRSNKTFQLHFITFGLQGCFLEYAEICFYLKGIQIMNSKILFLSTILASGSAFSAPLIFDTDGDAGRVTYFSNGAIDAMVTQSSSATNLRIYTPHFTNSSPCQSAQVYDQNTDKLLAQMNIEFNVMTATLPTGYEHNEKYVEALCTSPLGESYRLRHKIAAVPQLTLSSEISVSNWIAGDEFNPGFYQDVEYRGMLNINNHEPNGFCSVSTFSGNLPNPFQQRPSHEIISDVLVFSGYADYDAKSRLVAREITCTSTGGQTLVQEIWHISKGEQKRTYTVSHR